MYQMEIVQIFLKDPVYASSEYLKKSFRTFIQSIDSSPCSQKSTTCSSPSPVETIPNLNAHFSQLLN